MKIKFLLMILCANFAHADGPRVAVEYENEKDNKSGITNQALTVIPGWDFAKDKLINRAEIMLEENRDDQSDATGRRPKERKIFARLRHNGTLSTNIDYYVRGGIGKAFNNDANYSYAYLEPGIKFKFNEKWSWTGSYREINSIDGAAGKHVKKVITGPSFNLDNENSFDFRYLRGHGDKDVTAFVLEYSHKY